MIARRERTLGRDKRHAVIDIGSNTVRLVIYGDPPRAPVVLWNEKVAARLGRDLSETGAIPQEAIDEALAALSRYALIIRDLEIEHVEAVATAAAREASNGAQFLARVRKLGIDVRLLSGEEEACVSAMGALGAFPGADGTVVDIGGGSLELAVLSANECAVSVSLPLGTLRLPALRRKSGFKRRIAKVLKAANWAEPPQGPLFMVGGTWRALAAYAMDAAKYPLTDPHGFRLGPDDADRLARKLLRSKPSKLATIRGISAMRAEKLPDAAALLRVLLDTLQPSELIFSSWGLREGLLYSALDPLVQMKDPLAAAVTAFTARRGVEITHAAKLAAWTVDVGNGGVQRSERLRLAAAQLAMALQRVEPNLRINYATEWSLDKRWLDCNASERAILCAALFGALGRTGIPETLRLIASDDALREAVTWGLTIRVAQRLGACSEVSLSTSSLRQSPNEGKLILRLDQGRAALATYPVTRDLEMLADWLQLKPAIDIGSPVPLETTA